MKTRCETKIGLMLTLIMHLSSSFSGSLKCLIVRTFSKSLVLLKLKAFGSNSLKMLNFYASFV